MSRYFIYLAYDGSAYHGWQIQPNGSSVQQTLADALSTLFRQEVEVTGAGRTDAGVHARLMVAHFDIPEALPASECNVPSEEIVSSGKNNPHEEQHSSSGHPLSEGEITSDSESSSEEQQSSSGHPLSEGKISSDSESSSEEINSFKAKKVAKVAETPVDVVRLADKLNRILPHDISVYKVVQVKPDAHARFHATYRTYEYFITTRKDPFARAYSYRLFRTPDFELMNQAAQLLLQHTDFTSFSKLHTDVKTNNCRVMRADWQPVDDHTWKFTIQADRFLRNMVRAVVGTLLMVGQGKISVEEFNQIILRKDRCSAGTSVPGQALFLVDIGYPQSLFL